MKRGSQPRAPSPSTAPRRPDLTLTCTQWRGGQELITGTGQGAADERGGSRGGRLPDHCAQTPARSRGRRGEVCTEDAGLAAAWSDPRQTPTEGAKLGPQGQAGGGAKGQKDARGLGRAGTLQGAPPCRRLPPPPTPNPPRTGPLIAYCPSPLHPHPAPSVPAPQPPLARGSRNSFSQPAPSALNEQLAPHTRAGGRVVHCGGKSGGGGRRECSQKRLHAHTHTAWVQHCPSRVSVDKGSSLTPHINSRLL